MKKMAKAPLSCKFKCGRDVPANLNVRNLDGQRHKTWAGRAGEKGREGRELTPMDTHQGLDMKKRPGQANGQCGAGRCRAGLRRRQTRPRGRERAEEGAGASGSPVAAASAEAAAWRERGRGGGGGRARRAPCSPQPRHADPKMKDYFKLKKKVSGGCRGREARAEEAR